MINTAIEFMECSYKNIYFFYFYDTLQPFFIRIRFVRIYLKKDSYLDSKLDEIMRSKFQH